MNLKLLNRRVFFKNSPVLRSRNELKSADAGNIRKFQFSRL